MIVPRRQQWYLVLLHTSQSQEICREDWKKGVIPARLYCGYTEKKDPYVGKGKDPGVAQVHKATWQFVIQLFTLSQTNRYRLLPDLCLHPHWIAAVHRDRPRPNIPMKYQPRNKRSYDFLGD